jgi:hypothetical protein
VDGVLNESSPVTQATRLLGADRLRHSRRCGRDCVPGVHVRLDRPHGADRSPGPDCWLGGSRMCRRLWGGLLGRPSVPKAWPRPLANDPGVARPGSSMLVQSGLVSSFFAPQSGVVLPRMCLRRLRVSPALIAVMVLLAGCGSGTAGRRSPASTSTALMRCRSAQLTVRQGRLGAAAGSSGTSVIFKNVSSSRCWLEGYPRLQMFNAADRPLPTFVHDGASFMTIPPRLRVRVIKLAPGAAARVYLGFFDSFGGGSANCPASASLRITPPGDHTPINVPWRLDSPGAIGRPGRQRLQCGQMAISPVAATVKGWA